MSYTRNLAGAVALLASSSLLGLGCAVAADDKSDDATDESVVADTTKADEQGLTQSDDSAATKESTGESKDALWGRGFGGFGHGFGFGGYGRGFGGYGRGFGGYGRGIGWGGYGGYGLGYGGYGLGYGGYGLGYPVYGYPVYGYGGYGGYGGCGY